MEGDVPATKKSKFELEPIQGNTIFGAPWSPGKSVAREAHPGGDRTGDGKSQILNRTDIRKYDFCDPVGVREISVFALN